MDTRKVTIWSTLATGLLAIGDGALTGAVSLDSTVLIVIACIVAAVLIFAGLLAPATLRRKVAQPLAGIEKGLGRELNGKSCLQTSLAVQIMQGDLQRYGHAVSTRVSASACTEG